MATIGLSFVGINLTMPHVTVNRPGFYVVHPSTMAAAQLTMAPTNYYTPDAAPAVRPTYCYAPGPNPFALAVDAITAAVFFVPALASYVLRWAAVFALVAPVFLVEFTVKFVPWLAAIAACFIMWGAYCVYDGVSWVVGRVYRAVRRVTARVVNGVRALF